MSNTLKHVTDLHWIVVEDSDIKTKLVHRVLKDSGVSYTQLNVRTRSEDYCYLYLKYFKLEKVNIVAYYIVRFVVYWLNMFTYLQSFEKTLFLSSECQPQSFFGSRVLHKWSWVEVLLGNPLKAQDFNPLTTRKITNSGLSVIQWSMGRDLFSSTRKRLNFYDYIPITGSYGINKTIREFRKKKKILMVFGFLFL